MSSEEERYRESVGREPRRLPEDHPDAWQWEYRGTKAEREELLGRLEPEVPIACEGQEELPL